MTKSDTNKKLDDDCIEYLVKHREYNTLPDLIERMERGCLGTYMRYIANKKVLNSNQIEGRKSS